MRELWQLYRRPRGDLESAPTLFNNLERRHKMNTQPGYAYSLGDIVLLVHQGTIRYGRITGTTAFRLVFHPNPNGRQRVTVGWNQVLHNSTKDYTRRCTVLNDIEKWLVNPSRRCLLVAAIPTQLYIATCNKRMSQVRHLFREAVDTKS
jgi:hypothetical protein